jgi:uncharacterized protein (DUF983 family)
VPLREPRVRTLFWRALRLRCPHCGGRPLFVTWFRILPACPSCGLTLERGERGYWLGAYFVGLVAIETVFCTWWVLVMWTTWPDIPWRFLHLTTIGLLLGTAIGFYPFSHTLFLAFDLVVHPAEEEDFAAPAESGAGARRGRRNDR